jgi:hypothetical protein
MAGISEPDGEVEALTRPAFRSQNHPIVGRGNRQPLAADGANSSNVIQIDHRVPVDAPEAGTLQPALKCPERPICLALPIGGENPDHSPLRLESANPIGA